MRLSVSLAISHGTRWTTASSSSSVLG
uniref:Uncharacterized protein n=1 Tax=Arundo donax TaxID=35708 RepID=A0A0A8Z757_ARUDO